MFADRADYENKKSSSTQCNLSTLKTSFNARNTLQVNIERPAAVAGSHKNTSANHNVRVPQVL